MDSGAVWRHVDTQRAELADLIEAIDARDPASWDTPSLCAGWTVGDVAAHLTLPSVPMSRMLLEGNTFRIRHVVLWIGPFTAFSLCHFVFSLSSVSY